MDDSPPGQVTTTWNVAPAVTPSVAPSIVLVTRICPKIGTVGLDTVSVVDPFAGITPTGPGTQIGVPQMNAGARRDGEGGTSWTAHAAPAGRPPTVTLAPSASTWVPVKSGPQS